MDEVTGSGVVGVVLAAGGGRRYGMPKALVREPDGVAWLARACATLVAGGADGVVVALGARADEARRLVPTGARVVHVADWEHGLGASLAAVLQELEAQAEPEAADSSGGRWTAVVVTLVDLPGQVPAAVRRVVSAGEGGSSALCQAEYDGVPGHPVLIGRAHWAPLREGLAGDVGARAYLAAHGALRVDCTDLGGGDDVDVPAPGR